jgi:hypothetical protein
VRCDVQDATLCLWRRPGFWSMYVYTRTRRHKSSTFHLSVYFVCIISYKHPSRLLYTYAHTSTTHGPTMSRAYYEVIHFIHLWLKKTLRPTSSRNEHLSLVTPCDFHPRFHAMMDDDGMQRHKKSSPLPCSCFPFVCLQCQNLILLTRN